MVIKDSYVVYVRGVSRKVWREGSRGPWGPGDDEGRSIVTLLSSSRSDNEQTPGCRSVPEGKNGY